MKESFKRANSISFSAKERAARIPGEGEHILWWVLPFHPVIYKSRLSRKLKETMLKWTPHINFVDKIMIYWKNERKAHMFTLRW